MFRNQYDNDVTVWSPQGRLHQVEYAMEAVKLGSATIGLKSKTHACLIALKRQSTDLADSQRKIIPIDAHIGISFSGFTPDGRVLCRYLRQECLNYTYRYGSRQPVSRLIWNLGVKMQMSTQRYDRRPFGVGLLVAGYDELGPHIYQTCPSANFFDTIAMSIGSRSQSARTYLENNCNTFADLTIDDLIIEGLKAINGCITGDVPLTADVVEIAYVDATRNFTILSKEETQEKIRIKDTPAEPAAAVPQPDDAVSPRDVQPDESMDQQQ